MLAPPRHRAGAVVLVPAAVDGDLELVVAGRQGRTCPSRSGRRGRASAGPASQSGCQSPGQPISLLSVPGTLTASGWSTGPPPPPPPSPAAAGRRRSAYVWATDRLPLWSRSTARYSTSVPLARSVTSWNTRYGALSSVPSGVHVVGAGRAPGDRHLVEAVGRDGDADLGPPADDAAGAGRAEVHRRRVALRAARRLPARHTTALSGGTVTVTRPSPSLRTSAVPAGHRPRKFVLRRNVRTRRSARRVAVVEGDDVLALLVGVDAAERVDAGVAAGVAVDLGAVGQRRVLGAQRGQLGEVPVHRVVGVEVVVGRRGVGADEVVVVVRRRPATGTCPGGRPGRRRRR